MFLYIIYPFRVSSHLVSLHLTYPLFLLLSQLSSRRPLLGFWPPPPPITNSHRHHYFILVTPLSRITTTHAVLLLLCVYRSKFVRNIEGFCIGAVLIRSRHQSCLSCLHLRHRRLSIIFLVSSLSPLVFLVMVIMKLVLSIYF